MTGVDHMSRRPDRARDEAEIERIEREKAETARRSMPNPIRVFVGCAANNDDLESMAVLEWSLRKHTSRPLEITWMQLSRDPASPFYSDGPHGWQTRFWTTPFSGFRWAVPELCGFEGQAIYTDSDVIFRADIAELWNQPIPAGKMVIAKGGQRLCVSKWDCAAAEKSLPPLTELQGDPRSHRSLMRWIADSPTLVEPFHDGDWNTLDLEPFDLASPRVKALHCTGIPTQPQLRHALPRLAREGGRHWFGGVARRHPRPEVERLFDKLLAEATAHGFGIERYRREPFGEYNIRAGR